MVCCCPLSRLAEFPLLAAMWVETTAPLATPSRRTRTLFMEAPKTPTGTLAQKGAWVADVTYERDLINLTGVNGLDGYDLIV